MHLHPPHTLRTLAAGVAAAALALGVGGLTASSATAASTTTVRSTTVHSSTVATTAPEKAGGLAIRRVAVSASQVPAQVKSSLARVDASPDATVYLYEFVSNADGLCLDANSSGSTAGTNGDKVQLWTCNGTSNQFWYGADITGGYVDLVNAEYQSECLNAADNGGLANGRPVQLWACSVNTSNMAWFWTDDYIFLLADAPNYVLDATSQHLGNGDQIQIWNDLGAANQRWSYVSES